VQKEAIWPIEPAPTTIPPRCYPCNPKYLASWSPEVRPGRVGVGPGSLSMGGARAVPRRGWCERTGSPPVGGVWGGSGVTVDGRCQGTSLSAVHSLSMILEGYLGIIVCVCDMLIPAHFCLFGSEWKTLV